MKRALLFVFVTLIALSCTPPEIEKAVTANIRYCRNCITIKDAIEFENNIGSQRLNLELYEISAYQGKVTKAFSPSYKKNLLAIIVLFLKENHL